MINFQDIWASLTERVASVKTERDELASENSVMRAELDNLSQSHKNLEERLETLKGEVQTFTLNLHNLLS